MSESDALDRALNESSLLSMRGRASSAQAPITATAFLPDGSACAFADGDGVLHLATRQAGTWPDPASWRAVAVHDGPVLSLAALPEGFASGGDDQRLCLTPPAGEPVLIDKARGWVGHLAAWLPARAKGAERPLLAVARGKSVEVRDDTGRLLKTFAHASTVEGVAFDPKGKRVFAAHYGGLSVWFIHAKFDSVRPLLWKGSHLAVAVHPAGEAVVSAMQENALHGWTLPAAGNLRMAGYPAKPLSMAFSRSGRWLASSGADAIVLWPFFGGGPAGKAPKELAQLPGRLVTRVAFHPVDDIVACGYDDGTAVLAELDGERLLPICGPKAGLGPVSALAFSPDGTALAIGGESGAMAVIDLAAKG